MCVLWRDSLFKPCQLNLHFSEVDHIRQVQTKETPMQDIQIDTKTATKIPSLAGTMQ